MTCKQNPGSTGNPSGPKSHLTLSRVFYPRGKKAPTLMMVDSGATSLFMNRTFARMHDFEEIGIEHPQTVTVIDGREVSGGVIPHKTQVIFAIGGHVEKAKFYLSRD
jgi:hypothetical protein